MSSVLLLHGYSADNRGDGLLVEEAVSLIQEAVGNKVAITLCASHPGSFKEFEGINVVDSGPGLFGYSPRYLATLRSIREYDLVVGVGGGYLRGGYPMELLKTALIHGPQLTAAAWRGSNVVYLPQSIGPLRFGSGYLVNKALSRIDSVMLRDERSMNEVSAPGIARFPDVAALGLPAPSWKDAPNRIPVLSVRELRGTIPAPVVELAGLLTEYDGYVQSKTSGNDDREAMASLQPAYILDEHEFLDGDHPRVVVAMRLHGALMALRSGHFVIHLAYERKGFGAFADLGLDEFVYNSKKFDPRNLAAQVRELLTDESARKRYSDLVGHTMDVRQQRRDEIVRALRRSIS